MIRAHLFSETGFRMIGGAPRRRVARCRELLAQQASGYLARSIWQTFSSGSPAFDLWAATQDADDLAVLQAATSDVDLAASRSSDSVVDRGDSSVVPALIEKIRDRPIRSLGGGSTRTNVWNQELTETLDYVLSWRRDHVAQNWDEAIEEDWRTQEVNYASACPGGCQPCF